MKTDQIRSSYLEFFKKKAHSVVSSDSLVPQNDPTLLFTGAGMNQFKEYFLGLKKDMKRATSSQKCLRTGDLDNVGVTPYHHSFFEMLGNFSFGDYFKEEAITWAWEYLTEVLKIPTNKLRVTVHKSDDEAYAIWRDKIKVREDWITKMGDHSNFWPADAPKLGPNGPCGPCSEIYYDQSDDPEKPGDVEKDSKRFAEIWNLVFTQYDRQEGGKLAPLANKNIDTGAGLERIACVMQGRKTNFEIDIFEPILKAIEKALHAKLKDSNKQPFYAIADHVRAVVFSMADGVIPSNEGRGYVIRKLIRRSLWHAHQLVPEKRIEKPFLYKIVPDVCKVMQKAYPELEEARHSIATTLQGEEERFLDTLETGLTILEKKLDEFKSKKKLPGELVFELYDTYGFPDELTRAIADTRKMEIDQKGFDRMMAEQKKRAKQASQIHDAIFVSTDLEKKILAQKPTKFLGYHNTSGKGKVLLSHIENKQGVVVVDQSPCYAEGGGQVGDQGLMKGKSFEAKILDTQKKDQVYLHYVEVKKGNIKEGDTVEIEIDTARRNRTMRNHTATHLLHAALRNILGKQVRQLGSLVSPDKLRFDYSYPKPLTAEQIQEIEQDVNQEILKNTEVTKEEKETDQAKKEGAIAFFGEKYGKKVRVVSVPGYSKEFCGGTHCDRTGQIGSLLIVSDTSIASGTRRIEALTGEGALEYTRSLRGQISGLSQSLRTVPAQLGERVLKLQETVKRLEKDKQKGLSRSLDPKDLIKQAKKAGKFSFVTFYQPNLQMSELRHLADVLKSHKDVVFLLATESEEKIAYLSGKSHDLIKTDLDMGDMMKKSVFMYGATGGGRKDMVQGGGRNTGQFKTKWDEIVEAGLQYLKSKGK